eukprot:2526140-Rhodomonas_salina.2
MVWGSQRLLRWGDSKRMGVSEMLQTVGTREEKTRETTWLLVLRFFEVFVLGGSARYGICIAGEEPRLT